MEELAPGVRLLERGWLSSNNVVLHSAATGQALVVDTGHVRHAAQTVALVAEALAGAELVGIVNTHLHSDHCGGNAALSGRFGVPVWIPPGDFEAASAWDTARLSFLDTGQACERFTPAGMLMPGTHLPAPFDRWEIHAAPGHDPASVMLFEPGLRVLVSADALWEDGFGIVFPELDGRDAFGEVEASLDLIERLGPVTVVPGHGAAFSEVREALVRARGRLDYFRRQPERHALFAAKALLVFHLMEAGALSMDAAMSWAANTPVFGRIWQLAGAPNGFEGWLEGVIKGLMDKGTVTLHCSPDGTQKLVPR